MPSQIVNPICRPRRPIGKSAMVSRIVLRSYTDLSILPDNTWNIIFQCWTEPYPCSPAKAYIAASAWYIPYIRHYMYQGDLQVINEVFGVNGCRDIIYEEFTFPEVQGE